MLRLTHRSTAMIDTRIETLMTREDKIVLSSTKEVMTVMEISLGINGPSQAIIDILHLN